MNKVLLILLFLGFGGPQKSLAQELFSVKARVNVRDENFKIRVREVELTHLLDRQHFLGEYAQVVEGASNDPIPFDSPNQDLVFRAATVYYHFQQMLFNYQERFGWDPKLKLGRITLRVNMNKVFSPITHFALGEDLEEYNNALIIPPSGKWREDTAPEWGYEIWFRPGKEEKEPSGVAQAGRLVNSRYLKNQLILNHFENSLDSATQSYARTRNFNLEQFVRDLAIGFVVIEAVPRVFQLLAPKETTIYLDTALVPEVIYTEVGHLILSPFMSLKRSTPILEGYSDYLTVSFTKHPKIAEKMGKAARNVAPVDAESKLLYEPVLDRDRSSWQDYVLSLLWAARLGFQDYYKRLGNEALGVELFDKLVWESASHLNSASLIREELLHELLEAISVVCPEEDQRPLSFLLRGVFAKKGL